MGHYRLKCRLNQPSNHFSNSHDNIYYFIAMENHMLSLMQLSLVKIAIHNVNYCRTAIRGWGCGPMPAPPWCRRHRKCHNRTLLPPNLLFLLFSSFFSPSVFYCLTSTVSSTPRKSPKAFKSYLEENPLPGISLCTIQFIKTCHEPKPTIALNHQDILSCQRSVTLSGFYLIVFKRCCC